MPPKPLKKPNRPNRKRPRDDNDGPIKRAYKGFEFVSRESSGRPGSPHSFFKESYDVLIHNESLHPDRQQQQQQSSNPMSQVVHRHANGLVIVTAGDTLLEQQRRQPLSPSSDASQSPNKKIEKITFQQEQAPVAAESAATKRKQQSKMLKGKNIEGTVQPSDVLATVLRPDGSTVELRACAWGSILEINPNMTPELLENDPLLDGYLAVILPTGPFPPPMATISQTNSLEAEGDEETTR